MFFNSLLANQGEAHMFYSNGNYEAFIRPRKPQAVDGKSAHLIGGGIASLTAAGFLIRDGQMDAKRITIYEASNICGGCLDGIKDPKEGYLFRGEREMEDHYECLWDLMRSIPSLDVKGASVLEDYYQVNKDYPNYSLCRTTHKRGQPYPSEGKMRLTPKAQGELMKLFYTHRRELYDKRFDEFVGEEFFKSDFWVYWLSMFAIAPWHGALEMKLYMNRFVQHFGGMEDLSTIKFTRLNQYDSLILPLVKWLEQQGVTIVYDTKVTNVLFDITPERKIARRIEWIQGGKRGGRDVTKNDLVLITNGSAVENTAWGDHHTPAKWNRDIQEGSIWALWRNIAAQDPAFGRPDKFCAHTDKTSYEFGMHPHPRRQDSALHRADLPARNVQSRREAHHGRLGDRARFQLDAVVERRAQPALQGPPEGPADDPRLRHVQPRPARQLRQEGAARVHRRGDRPGMALPPGGAGGSDQQAGGRVGGRASLHDALHHGLLHAPA